MRRGADNQRLPRCGARARSGRPCGQPAVSERTAAHGPGGYRVWRARNGRCRYHGGLSTGAKTEQGKLRQRIGRERYWAAWRAARGLAPRAPLMTPEEEELAQLRAAVADLARERDALTRRVGWFEVERREAAERFRARWVPRPSTFEGGAGV